ncbi:hypothetical protein [Burkholderia ubonensis]|uniref:hypothetical protein n=1 Tax=Burkholderia ubonensis TaxID=101571 RepID=UPI0007578875|nr:hypothetical protein [Burkholderia ubonensis]KVU10334.1 hypothetical protein WK61_23130 [Burkholderia ubonensis]
MSKYQKLDALILAEISDKPRRFDSIFAVSAIHAECRTFLGVREPFRVLDLRLQAPRKAGKIRSTSTGWVRV